MSAPTSSAACCGRLLCVRRASPSMTASFRSKRCARLKTKRSKTQSGYKRIFGLDVVTDGEMRRLNFQDSFGASVAGYDTERSTLKVYEQRIEGAAPGQRWDIPTMSDAGTAVAHRRPAKARLALQHNVPLDEYLFVREVAKSRPRFR